MLTQEIKIYKEPEKVVTTYQHPLATLDQIEQAVIQAFNNNILPGTSYKTSWGSVCTVNKIVTELQKDIPIKTYQGNACILECTIKSPSNYFKDYTSWNSVDEILKMQQILYNIN